MTQNSESITYKWSTFWGREPPSSGSAYGLALHDSDYEGVVRIFVALSCELWGYLFSYLFTRHKFSLPRSVTLHYADQFSPARSVNSKSDRVLCFHYSCMRIANDAYHACALWMMRTTYVQRTYLRLQYYISALWYL